MIKLRTAAYCNLKLLLMFLVIYAHLIEPQISARREYFFLYRTIYLFHMPLFAFVSGLFIRDTAGCIRQLRRMLPLYLIFQTIAVLLGKAPWHTPWWVLWYLLSLCFWLGLSALFLRRNRHKWWVLALSLGLGCLSGCFPWIGRPFGLSRTIVFFPWFWLGVILKPELPFHKLRPFTLPGLLLIFSDISPVTLYQAAPGPPLLRLRCYAAALALGLLVLSWCPRRRLPWTRAGTDTLPAYLLHAPLVPFLRQLPCPALTTAAFLYLIFKATQWHSAFGITGKEERPWPDSKTCTKPRASRFTGSYSP